MALLKIIFDQNRAKEAIEKLTDESKVGKFLPHEGRLRRCIAFSEGSSPEDFDFSQSWVAPNHTGDATLPLYGLAAREYLTLQAVLVRQAFNFIERIRKANFPSERRFA